MAYGRFQKLLVELSPPWLQRLTGGKALRALGAVVDELLVDRAVSGVKVRLTDVESDEGLGLLGRERRIRRGPGESAASYARRLRRWWIDHRVRGGPYALLRQFHAYLLEYAPGQIDLVAQSGLRHVCDETTGEITRDQITWGGDGDVAGAPVLLAGNALPGDIELRPTSIGTFPVEGRYALTLRSGSTSEVVYGIGTSTSPYGRVILEAPGVVGTYLAGPASVSRRFAKWARIWVFVHLGDLLVDELLTEAEDELLLEDGDTLEGEVSVFGGVFGPEDEAVWAAIPREWNAAHVQRTTIVLLQGNARLWGYPVPVPTFAEWAASGAFGGVEPVLIRIED